MTGIVIDGTMMTTDSDPSLLLKQLTAELRNFEGMARSLMPKPGDVPKLRGIEIYGGTIALNGLVGGDHLIYLDFKKRFDLDARIVAAERAGRWEVVENLRRCQEMAGVVLIDVSGHRVTDALLAAMLHQAFLLGAIYELDTYGHVTRRLLENLNTRFYQSSAAHKFVSLIYGEITEASMFRFISAAQPFPMVFSKRHSRFMDVDKDLCVSFPPLGILPSLDVVDRSMTTSVLGFKDHYQMNEWTLMGEGDILLLPTDGLVEHLRGDEEYCPGFLEAKLREVQDLSAKEIFDAIIKDVRAFGPLKDDISVVVIKKS